MVNLSSIGEELERLNTSDNSVITAIAHSLENVALPMPFDALTAVVGGVMRMIADFKQNKEDARRLLLTINLLVATVASLSPNTSSQAKAHAVAIKSTMDQVEKYLKKEVDEAERSFFKRLFAALNQAAKTSQIKHDIGQFDTTLNNQINQLTLGLVVDIHNVQQGGFNASQLHQLKRQQNEEVLNQRVMIQDAIKRTRNAATPDAKMEAYVIAGFILRQESMGNIDSSLAPELAKLREWHRNEDAHVESWKAIAQNDIKYNENNVVQTGVLFSTYKGSYLGQAVSVKVFDVDARVPLRAIEAVIKKDLQNWKNLSHLPYVHTLLGATTGAYPPKLISEYCPEQIDGYVFSHPEQIFRVLFELISGIDSIHEAKVIHRDLAPRDVLITAQGTVAISDFGMCRRNAQQVSTSLNRQDIPRPSINFQSPESMNRPHQTTATDVWSFGMMAYYLLSRKEPFVGLDEVEVRRSISANQLPPPLDLAAIRIRFGGIDLVPLWSLINLCWVIEPERRATCDLVKHVLQTCYKKELEVAPAKAGTSF
ncbi:UNVERIFIED_CONTAM: hypothetical protein HDU68_003672 [Siphonaria sp. JEL0065]|nr:hypothetical protein HDU68_003672 [Siphonaria sp. JEL0065]